ALPISTSWSSPSWSWSAIRRRTWCSSRPSRMRRAARWRSSPPTPPMAFPLPGGEQLRIGGMVCEDMWTGDVAEGLEESGAEILIVPNGSPFERDKQDVRLNLAVARVTETRLPLIYCNQVGGQDELVFDGASFAL